MGHGEDFPEPSEAIANLGFRNYLLYLYRQWRAGLKSAAISTVASKASRYPLFFRPHTTDLKVFSQIFMFREYAFLDFVEHPDLIVDCGANVGYSSAYFLTRFPRARVIAVEPDPGNFALLKRNLAPFGSRVRLHQTAVWSHPTLLTLDALPYRDGGEWARQARECAPDEKGGFWATDIGTLLKGSGYARISLLKIDIEGAEGVIFAKRPLPWLDLVDCLVIEIHDDTVYGDNRATVTRAMEDAGFQLTESGELSIGTRRATVRNDSRLVAPPTP